MFFDLTLITIGKNIQFYGNSHCKKKDKHGYTGLK